jgi:hypothetical protein
MYYIKLEGSIYGPIPLINCEKKYHFFISSRKKCVKQITVHTNIYRIYPKHSNFLCHIIKNIDQRYYGNYRIHYKGRP